jgi:hypothetical protein
VIVGGGTGGVAAALAAARRGKRVIMTEPTDWIGGQLTAQAVPPDENQWIETVGGTATYQDFRTRVRTWYRSNRPLTNIAAETSNLNPGGGWVSRICMEPRIAHAVLQDMLSPYVTRGLITILLHHDLSATTTQGDRVTSVTLKDVRTGATTNVTAAYVLDATELGDVYEHAGVEHAIGSDARATFGEMHAPEHADPRDQQAFSWCFAIENREGENHVGPKPTNYDFWRGYVPQMTPAWTGPLFSWTVPSHNEEGKRTFPFIPWPHECAEGVWDMWRYRRIVDAAAYRDANAFPDVCLVNWVQMDYWLKPLLGVSAAEQASAYAGAREQSMALLYWMQTEAPRHDGKGAGYPGLRLRGEELGTIDGFAKAAYIREPRRLIARTIVTEAHIGTEQRKAEGRPRQDEHPLGIAELFDDSVGIGHYTLDLHPSCSGRNNLYVPAAPFRIPLGSLIPVRVCNVIAAGKGIGVTHITNGCYRMHHTEWNIGESAGALAAWCVENNIEPAAVHASKDQTRAFQTSIMDEGVRVTWPWE